PVFAQNFQFNTAFWSAQIRGRTGFWYCCPRCQSQWCQVSGAFLLATKTRCCTANVGRILARSDKSNRVSSPRTGLCPEFPVQHRVLVRPNEGPDGILVLLSPLPKPMVPSKWRFPPRDENAVLYGECWANSCAKRQIQSFFVAAHRSLPRIS